MTTNTIDIDELYNNPEIQDFLKYFITEGITLNSSIPSSTVKSAKPIQVPDTIDKFRDFIKNKPEGKNIWILTVVSVPFKKKFKQFFPKRSPYLRSFVLYNLSSGDTIPCLMKKSPKTAKNLYAKMEKNRPETEQKDMKLINTYEYYYNISNDKIGEVFKGKKKYSNVVKNQTNYIKKKKLLPISYDLLQQMIKDNDDFRDGIIDDIYNILFKIKDNPEEELDKLYIDQKDTPTFAPNLLKYTDSLKTSSSFFSSKYNITGIKSSGIQINRQKWKDTENVIKSFVKLNIFKKNIDEGSAWAINFS